MSGCCPITQPFQHFRFRLLRCPVKRFVSCRRTWEAWLVNTRAINFTWWHLNVTRKWINFWWWCLRNGGFATFLTFDTGFGFLCHGLAVNNIWFWFNFFCSSSQDSSWPLICVFACASLLNRVAFRRWRLMLCWCNSSLASFFPCAL